MSTLGRRWVQGFVKSSAASSATNIITVGSNETFYLTNLVFTCQLPTAVGAVFKIADGVTASVFLGFDMSTAWVYNGDFGERGYQLSAKGNSPMAVWVGSGTAYCVAIGYVV